MAATSLTRRASKRFISIALALLFLLSQSMAMRALPAQIGNPYLWSIQTVERSEGGISLSLRFDPSGTLHAAIAGGHLFYATYSGGSWSRQFVDDSPTGGGGETVALAFDKSGHPHIAYGHLTITRDSGKQYVGQIRHAYWDGARWILQPVATYWPSGAPDLALALDAFDNPHIAFSGAWNLLQYASASGSQWIVQTIDSCGSAVSLAISPDGSPHVSYLCGGLKYATLSGSQWNVSALDGASASHPSLALDSSGDPHVAYYTGDPPHQLRYISRGGASWGAPEIVDTGDLNTYRGGASLALDGQDLPHISYIGTGSTLKYASWDGSAWQIMTVPDAVNLLWGSVFPNTSLAMDDGGKAHVVYISAPLEQMQYTFQDAGTGLWTAPQVVDSLSSLGRMASLAIDSNNLPHVSYLDAASGQLKYAHWDGVQWTAQAVDFVRTWQAQNSIKVDGSNLPRIAYVGLAGLMYASGDGTQWNVATVNPNGSSFPSLALDKTTGLPSISYASGAHKYASWDGAAWTSEIVDSQMGAPSSLTLDSSGDPHIAYALQASDQSDQLAYIYRAGSTWSIPQKVDPDGSNPGTSTGGSLALDSQGNPHIAFCGMDSGLGSFFVVRYASWDGSSWSKQTVDTEVNSCGLVSLAIDKDDHPHISYTDLHDGTSLDYATWDGSAWVVERIPTNQAWTADTYFAPIAVGPDDSPWIAYGDSGTLDMMIAHGMVAYTISGQAGVGGAIVDYAGDSVAADTGGNYSIVVPSGWSGAVTPSKSGYTFTPDHIDYTGVTTDQTGQDYVATALPPPVVWSYPPDGAQACLRPPVGLQLLLSGITASPWTLKLDGADVTSDAMAWEILMNPPRAMTMYTPTADLTPGGHRAEFDYETSAGPRTLLWSFSVVDSLPCPTDTGSLAPTLDGAPPSSSADSLQPGDGGVTIP